MDDDQPNLKNNLSPEWLLRGTLMRLGDKLDLLTGRKGITPSSLATSQLIERLKRLLDSKAKDIPGKGKVVPHNISLRVQWDKFSTGENDTLDRLQEELLAAAADHINDSLYYTFAPLAVQVTSDYFTEGITLLASFDTFADDDEDKKMNITVPGIQIPISQSIGPTAETACQRILQVCIDPNGKAERSSVQVPVGGRISVGRTGGNHLTIDDPSISKIHASLSVGPGGEISVADTGSTNGTFVNGQRIAYGNAIKLDPSDVVKFGTVEAAFEIVESQADGGEKMSENLSNEETISIGEFEFTTKTPTASNATPAGQAEKSGQIKSESEKGR